MNPRAGAFSVESGTARYSDNVVRDDPPSESGWKLTRFPSGVSSAPVRPERIASDTSAGKSLAHADLFARGEQGGPVPLALGVIEKAALVVHEAGHSRQSGRGVVELGEERRRIRLAHHRAKELARGPDTAERRSRWRATAGRVPVLPGPPPRRERAVASPAS